MTNFTKLRGFHFWINKLCSANEFFVCLCLWFLLLVSLK